MFRFTIRDVLWLTVVVAVVTVWRVDLARQETSYRDVLEHRFAADPEEHQLIAKARLDPQLRAELIALSKEDSAYAAQSLRHRRSVRQQLHALMSKARALPDSATPPAVAADTP